VKRPLRAGTTGVGSMCNDARLVIGEPVSGGSIARIKGR